MLQQLDPMRNWLEQIDKRLLFLWPLYSVAVIAAVFVIDRGDILHFLDIFLYAPIFLVGLVGSKRFAVIFTCLASALFAGVLWLNVLPIAGHSGIWIIIFEMSVRIFLLNMSGVISYAYAEQHRGASTKLEEAVKERTQHVYRLQAYLAMTESLSKDFNLQTRLNEFMDACLFFVEAESGSILLRHKKGDKLVLAAQGTYKQRQDFAAKKAEELADYVTRKGESLLLTETVDCPKLKGIKNAMYAPLLIENDVIGVMYVCNKLENGTFSQRDLNLFTSIAKHAATYIQNAHLFSELQELNLNIIMTLVHAVEAKDRYTRGHSIRVTELALQLGRELGLRTQDMELLQTAGLLHDVGKIGVPEAILLKPSRLTEDEYEQIKQHPAIGAAILQPIKGLEEVAQIVYYHHERYDGQGYLEGLRGENIPQPARILAVCDTFAAMTSDRPHRKSLSEKQAVGELRRVAGTQLDPIFVEVLLKIIEKKAITVEKLKVGV